MEVEEIIKTVTTGGKEAPIIQIFTPGSKAYTASTHTDYGHDNKIAGINNKVFTKPITSDDNILQNDENISFHDSIKFATVRLDKSNYISCIEWANNTIQQFMGNDEIEFSYRDLANCYKLKSEAYKFAETQGSKLFAVLCNMAHNSTLNEG
jgi:hypothetical protein